MTRPCPSDMELFVPRALISPIPERTYSFTRVRSSPLILWRCFTLSCRWYPYHCGFDCAFGSCPPSNHLQYQGYVAHLCIHKPYHQFLQIEHYQNRVRVRDPCCLISGLPVVRDDYSRFKAAHIFPRGHEVHVHLSSFYALVRLIPMVLTLNIQWINRGYPSRITDPAPLGEVGGSTKIDSIQNVLLLRGDLHDA